MTAEDLAFHDGREGRRALVAINGRIYDFTDSPLWRHGNHEDRHRAGCDLSEELKGAPHVRAVIERFPVVGTLEEVGAPRPQWSTPLLLIAATVILVLVLLFLM